MLIVCVIVSEGPPWTVIGVVVGVAVLLAMVAGLVMWWMRRKQYREDTKQ